MLNETDHQILEILNTSKGSLIENETLFNILSNSKTLINNMNNKQLRIKEIETELHQIRSG